MCGRSSGGRRGKMEEVGMRTVALEETLERVGCDQLSELQYRGGRWAPRDEGAHDGVAAYLFTF